MTSAAATSIAGASAAPSSHRARRGGDARNPRRTPHPRLVRWTARTAPIDDDGDDDASAAEDGSGDERDDDGWPRYSPPGGGARVFAHTRASEGRASEVEEEEEEGKENVDPRAFDRSFDDAVEELEARITKKLVALLDH